MYINVNTPINYAKSTQIWENDGKWGKWDGNAAGVQYEYPPMRSDWGAFEKIRENELLY